MSLVSLSVFLDYLCFHPESSLLLSERTIRAWNLYKGFSCTASSVPHLMLPELLAALTARAFVVTWTSDHPPRLLCSLQFRFPSEKLDESSWKVMKSAVGGAGKQCLCCVSHLHLGSFLPSLPHRVWRMRPFPAFGELRCHPGLSSQKC